MNKKLTEPQQTLVHTNDNIAFQLCIHKMTNVTHTLHLCSQCDAHPETSGSDTDFHMKNMHGQKQDNRICKQLIE